MTREEQELFRNLSQTEIGRQLLAYFKKVENLVYDSRNWKGDENKDSASLAARVLREHLIEKIGPKSDNSVKIGGEYES